LRSKFAQFQNLSLLKTIGTQIGLFRKALGNAKTGWYLSLKEKNVIKAVFDGDYEDNDVEGVFFRYGEFRGIITLILFFRSKNQSLRKIWATIGGSGVQEGGRGVQEWFVKHVTQMLEQDIVEKLLPAWINSYNAWSAQGMVIVLQIIHFC